MARIRQRIAAAVAQHVRVDREWHREIGSGMGDAKQLRRAARGCFVFRPDFSAQIGIGGNLTAPPLPHHRTYGSVYGGSGRIERTPVPAGGVAAGVLMRASAKALRSLHGRAVGLHPSGSASRTDSTAYLPHGAFEMRVSTSHFLPFGPSPERAPPTMPSCRLLRCDQIDLRRSQSPIRDADADLPR